MYIQMIRILKRGEMTSEPMKVQTLIDSLVSATDIIIFDDENEYKSEAYKYAQDIPVNLLNAKVSYWELKAVEKTIYLMIHI